MLAAARAPDGIQRETYLKLIIVSTTGPRRLSHHPCVRYRCADNAGGLRKGAHEMETESWQMQADAKTDPFAG